MKRLISMQTIWIWLLLVLTYVGGSLLTVYFSTGSFRLGWSLCLFALAIPIAQTLLLRLLRRWFRSGSKEPDSAKTP
jgi:hypothetical protein